MRGGHGLILGENRNELNRTVFKIHNNRTELNCLSYALNRTELLKWFGFIVLNQTITNFLLKQIKILKKTERN
jgi:hypothetical protein